MRRDRLIAARKASGKSQEKVGELAGVDRTTIGTWERGEYTPQPHQRPAYARALGISLSELDAMLTSMPSDGDDMPEWLSTYLGMEQSAIAIRAHEPELVYGLLQTPAYTRAAVRHVGLHGAPDSYVEEAVEQRRIRQAYVKDGRLTVDVIQAEQTLRVRVGDPAIMAEQLTSLADAAEQPNVTVRVTTFDAGQHEARRLDSFLVMRHSWGNPRVWIEGYSGGRFITDADEVNYFTAVFDHAAGIALSPGDSVGFIRNLASEWEQRI